MTDFSSGLSQAVQNGDDKKVVKLVKKALAEGVPAMDILEKGLVPGVQALGQLFKDGQVYLPEILISTRAMNKGLEALQPHLGGADIHQKGTVVLGTVEGDLHDIGKNLVAMMLEGAGFEVVDLGNDVPAERFVEAAVEHKAGIIGMSALLTTTMYTMKDTIELLKEHSLVGRVKTMVGGAPVTASFAKDIGADGYGDDAATAVDIAKKFIGS